MFLNCDGDKSSSKMNVSTSWDEVREADLLIHVVDISHAAYEEHIKTVEDTLLEIGSAGKPTITVFNKIDLATEIEMTNLVGSKKTKSTFISAKNRDNIDHLKDQIYQEVKKRHLTIFPNYLKKEMY